MLAGNTAVVVHNCGGTEANAQLLSERATELQSQVGYGGTTSVARVRNIADPGRTEVWVANNKKYMPSGWKKGPSVGLRPGEVFVELDGHAEESILAALGDEWEIVEGGTSTGICWAKCTPLLKSIPDVVIGGPEYRHGPKNSSKRLFWKP